MIINVYHVRDAYDHSLGYWHNNTYMNVDEAVLKEVMSKQERYIKNNDIGGYWVQITTVLVGQTPIVEDRMKTLPQRTRIELNVKAKREGKRKSMEETFAAINAQIAIPAAIWAQPVAPMMPDVVIDEPQVAQQEEWL